MKRPTQHVMETDSIRLVQNILPTNWLIRELPHDYGIDLEIELVEGETVTGKRLWVQLKSVSKLEYKKIKSNSTGDTIEYFNYRIHTKFLNYALSCGNPVSLFIANLSNKQIYFIDIRDMVNFNLRKQNPSWKEQETIHIPIPTHNNISDDLARYNTKESFIFTQANKLSFLYDKEQFLNLLNNFDNMIYPLNFFMPGSYSKSPNTSKELLEETDFKQTINYFDKLLELIDAKTYIENNYNLPISPLEDPRKTITSMKNAYIRLRSCQTDRKSDWTILEEHYKVDVIIMEMRTFTFFWEYRQRRFVYSPFL